MYDCVMRLYRVDASNARTHLFAAEETPRHFGEIAGALPAADGVAKLKAVRGAPNYAWDQW